MLLLEQGREEVEQMPPTAPVEEVVDWVADDDMPPVPGHHSIAAAAFTWEELDDLSVMDSPNNHSLMFAAFKWAADEV